MSKIHDGLASCISLIHDKHFTHLEINVIHTSSPISFWWNYLYAAGLKQKIQTLSFNTNS